MFSGGSYHEVERWLHTFLTSHAKRVSPRVEVLLDAGEARAETSYGARLRLGERTTDALELDYPEVARNRGSLAWGAAPGGRAAGRARGLVAAASRGAGRSPGASRASPVSSSRRGEAPTPGPGNRSPRWLGAGDLNGFLGLALDNLTQLHPLSSPLLRL